MYSGQRVQIALQKMMGCDCQKYIPNSTKHEAIYLYQLYAQAMYSYHTDTHINLGCLEKVDVSLHVTLHPYYVPFQFLFVISHWPSIHPAGLFTCIYRQTCLFSSHFPDHLHPFSVVPGPARQWSRITGHHQQYRHDDKDKEHSHQLTRTFIHHGLSRVCQEDV